jgi:maltoporin
MGFDDAGDGGSKSAAGTEHANDMKTGLGAILAATALVAAQAFAAESPAPSPPGPEVEAIRREMQQLRQDYERRIQALEERLKQVEQGPAVSNAVTQAPATAVSKTNAVPSMAERSKAFAALEFQRDTESREWALAQEQRRPFRERVEQVLYDFVDIGGYFRAGYGRNDMGGPQTGFQAPGAFAKYRLGNEAENYGELVFGKNWYVPELFSLDSQVRPDGTPSGPIARTQIRLAFYEPYSDYTSASAMQVTLPEAWAEVGNVVAAQPSLKFWAGNRFYRRQDIHINDFYFYNMSGGGGGFEDLELPFGKVAFAWIGNGAQSGIYSSDIAALPDPNNLAGFSKQSLDLSIYDIPMPWGKGELGLVYAIESSGKDSRGMQAPNTDGFALTFLHRHDHFLSQDGFNRLSIQIGEAAAKTFTSGYETFTATNGTFIIPDPPGSWRFRVTENFVIQPWKHFSISPALVYQYTDYNNELGVRQWFSAGVRPIYHFNRNFSVAFEAGADYVSDSAEGYRGTLYKLTLAPQISLGDRFFSRPVIRFYITYAGWPSSFEGVVGGNDYVNQSSGISWGAQMETWW